MAGHRQVAADRGDGQTHAQPEVRPPGEALGDAVQQIQAEGERTQQQAQGIEQRGGQDERAAATPTETQAWVRERLPRGSSRLWVLGFRASNPRSAIRLNPMAAQRAAEKASTTRKTSRRHDLLQAGGRQHAEQGERQRKERVGQLDEVDVADEEGFAGVRLGFAGGAVRRQAGRAVVTERLRTV